MFQIRLGQKGLALRREEFTNERGNRVYSDFLADCDRYFFDEDYCAPSKGWQQFDTDQDAWYFGVWVHPAAYRIIVYAEGDVTITVCGTPEGFVREYEALCATYGPGPAFTTIAEDDTVTRHFQDREALVATPQSDPDRPSPG